MYNSSTKKLKAVLVAILAIVLLVNAVLPMTVMGSSKKNTGDYQYIYNMIPLHCLFLCLNS